MYDLLCLGGILFLLRVICNKFLRVCDCVVHNRFTAKDIGKNFFYAIRSAFLVLLPLLLMVDAYLTNIFVNWAQQFSILRQLKIHYMVLEISSRGKVWLITNLVLLWTVNNSNLYQMQVNLLIDLMLNIIVIGEFKNLKAARRRPNALRRRRPNANDNLFPKKEFFPSENAAHVAFITYFFLNVWPVSLIFVPPLLAWSFSVCMSKLLMRINYIGDILAGIALGILQGMLVEYIYLEQETCTHLVWWITDEKTSGAEYDV